MKRTLHALLLLLGLLPASAAPQQPLAWRGVMIDVSRHFVPLDDLKRQVDAMAHFGLNTLHLHLTDAAGWRLEIEAFPRLTEVGAWRTHPVWKTWWAGERRYGGPYGGFYTRGEMRQLVSYAAGRGVTIVPEIEFPAHSEEAIAAYPWLGHNHAEMDMQNDSTYAFMQTVLAEVADIFPGPYIHVGGDEAATQSSLQPQAMRRIHQMVRQLGRRMVVWDECATADTGLVVMAWRSMELARQAAAHGNDVVLCPGHWLYFDKAQDCPATEPESSGGYLPIDTVYRLPLQEMAPYAHRLLGVQANVWTEYIPSVPHLERMLWPRAVAVARLAQGEGPDPAAHLEALQWLRGQGFHAFPLDSAVGQRPEALAPVSHLARGAQVSYRRPFHAFYTAGGEQALTDGRMGGWDNADGRWQGFINGGVDVVVDLGAPQSVSLIQTHFLQSTAPEIFLPSRWQLSVSADGEQFDTLVAQTLPPSASPYCVLPLEWTAAPVSVRYVRLQAWPSPRGGWLFTDEIVVK